MQPSASCETNPTTSCRDEPDCFQSNPKPPAMIGLWMVMCPNLSQWKEKRSLGENFIYSTDIYYVPTMSQTLLYVCWAYKTHEIKKINTAFGRDTHKINHNIYTHNTWQWWVKQGDLKQGRRERESPGAAFLNEVLWEGRLTEVRDLY